MNTYLRAAALSVLLVPAVAPAAPPATSPYATDAQYTHVEDATSEQIGTVNMIMCYMTAMRPDALVNQPSYLALVDQNKCDTKAKADAANSGASSGATQAPSYLSATVTSGRATASDPMRVKVWFEDSSGGGASTILVNVSATAAPSATNPYGVFRLDFCGKQDPALPCLMQGYVEGKADGSLSYFQTQPEHGGSGGGGNHTSQLALTPAGTDRGSGSIQDSINGVAAGFTFAYDANLYLRSDGTTSQCFSRDASDPGTGQSVWRYGLYDATSGARVDRNSGFPIEFTAGGTTYSGYLSYWGLSLPADAAAALTSGATVSKVDYGNQGAPTRTDYTVVKSAGKLTKYTRQSRSLASLDQIRFNVWVGAEASGLYAGAVPNVNYELYWDEASGMFRVSGVLNCGNNGCETHSFAAVDEKAVDVSFWAAQAGITGYSNSLGGELFIDLRNVVDPVQSAAVNVVYRVQDMVYPTDFPAHLYCVRDCPTAATVASYFASGSSDASPFTAATFNNWNPTDAAGVVAYTPSAADAVLQDAAGQPVVIADAAALAGHPQYQNGLRTGRLIADLAAAECAPGTAQYCDYQVQNVDVFYVWESGPNPWNQFAAVRDAAGAFVTFDAPLQLTYAVPAGAQYGAYAGKTLVLQYGGFGQLWGIPGQCVSRDTNAAVSCDTPNSRYVPEFVIPDDPVLGVATTAGTGGGTPYLVKWLDREIRFAAKDPSECAAASLVLPAGVALPSAAALKDPSDPASDIYIGAKPAVSDAVRVIQGVIEW